MENQEKILVFYINIGNLPPVGVRNYMDKLSEEMSIGKPEGERHFFISVRDQESKVECIYPQFVAQKEAIENSNAKIIELNQILEEQIKNLKADEE